MTGSSDASSMRRRTRAQRALYIALRVPSTALMAPAAAVGGQAVMEGVMMRGPHSWAIAVRRHQGDIAVQHRELVAFGAKHRWARIPLVRGVVALFESLIIGMKALFVSSEYAIEGVKAQFDAEEAERERAIAAGEPVPERSKAELRELKEVERAAKMAETTSAIGVPVPLPHNEEHPEPDPDKLGTVAIVAAMIFAMGFSIALFKVVPVTIVAFVLDERDAWSFVLIEAGIKFAIFCAYLSLVGLMPDMKRVFQYHSAEHKAINAWERGVPLEPEAVNKMSRIHVRCGTAFIVWLFIVGMLVFRGAQLTFLEGADRWEIIATRPLLLPLIAGLSFELLRFAGKHADNKLLRVVLAPGLWFQRLTTRECTPEQCEVAIKSLNAVVDFEAKRRTDAEAQGVELEDDSDEDAYRVLA